MRQALKTAMNVMIIVLYLRKVAVTDVILVNVLNREDVLQRVIQNTLQVVVARKKLVVYKSLQ